MEMLDLEGFWGLMALSAQKGYIVPCEKNKIVKDINFR